jgi:hypothetical protein
VPDHAAFAEEIKRVGRRYFVQTPNKAFSLEPHVMTPLVNYLPKRWQRRLYRNFTLWGWLARPDQSYVDWFVEDRTCSADARWSGCSLGRASPRAGLLSPCASGSFLAIPMSQL